MTSPYRAREKIRVTFTLIPSARQAVIAGMLRLVAGILMNRLGRSTSRHSTRAWAMVASVSSASRGSTSIETRPSTPSVASYTGRSTSQASRTSVAVSSRSASVTPAPRAARSRIWAV